MAHKEGVHFYDIFSKRCFATICPLLPEMKNNPQIMHVYDYRIYHKNAT